MDNEATLNDVDASIKNAVLLVYILQAASFFVGFTFFIAPIVAYVKRGETKDNVLRSHFGWQIRSFWLYCLFAIIAGVLAFLYIVFMNPANKMVTTYYSFLGMFAILMFLNSVWFAIRIFRGALRLSKLKPMRVLFLFN